MPVNMLPIMPLATERMKELDAKIDWRKDPGFKNSFHKTLVRRKSVPRVWPHKVIPQNSSQQLSLFSPVERNHGEPPVIDYIEAADLAARYRKLYKNKAFKGIILTEYGHWYISYSAYDVWGEKERISFVKFRELVEEAEAAYKQQGDVNEGGSVVLSSPRKGPNRENGQDCVGSLFGSKI
jgi:hypothetical protein